MTRYRGNALAAGVLLIVCTVSAILSAVPLGTTLEETDYLTRLAASETAVNTALNVPILLQELVLAVWLLATGFTVVDVPAEGQLIDRPLRGVAS